MSIQSSLTNDKTAGKVRDSQKSGKFDLGHISLASAMDQVTSKEYLATNVFPKLEKALNSVSQPTLHRL